MSMIDSVVEYPEEGFAILKDDNGTFLAFRDSDRIEPVDDEDVYRLPAWVQGWKTELRPTQTMVS